MKESNTMFNVTFGVKTQYDGTINPVGTYTDEDVKQAIRYKSVYVQRPGITSCKEWGKLKLVKSDIIIATIDEATPDAGEIICSDMEIID